MIENFELAQASKRQLLGAEFNRDGQKIRNTLCEFDRSKFIRLSSESFLDFEGSQLEALKDVCFDAHKSEEFFLIINARNQWVRTVIGHKDLHPETWTATESSCIPVLNRIIHSNILPYDPYWSQVGDGVNRRVYFPSCMLEEAIKENKPLKTKLQEWMASGKKCEIGAHQRRQQGISKWFWEHWNKFLALVFKPRKTKWFWEIQATDVKFEDWIAEGNGISRVTWRGGRFVRKETYPEFVKREFEFVTRVNSHPNIVYGFGDLYDGTNKSAYFMEYMSTELFSLIVDRVTRVVGDNKPPFSPHDSIDILLQFAQAMKHIHQQGVVHCDLKSVNILISEIAMSDNASHYLVKVADFGSAQYFGDSSSRSSDFTAGNSTDRYAAPEALQQRVQLQRKEFFRINYPDRIDVFSFGIVAFEVLTGDTNHMLMHFSQDIVEIRKSRKRVIEGTLRPPLRTECLNNKEFIQDDGLISLIERCWHPDPAERPCFVKICEDLNKAKVRISEKMSQSAAPPSQADQLMASSSVPEVPSDGIIIGVDLRSPLAAVFLLAFMCLSSLIKEKRVADPFKFIALTLFAFIITSYLMKICVRVFLLVIRCGIRKFSDVFFAEKVKYE